MARRTADDVVAAFVAELKLGLPAPEPGVAFAAPTTRRRLKLRSVAEKCHRKRLPSDFLALLQKRLANEGVHVSPDVTDPALRLDHSLYFSLLPFPTPGFAFSSEEHLRALLLHGIERVTPLRNLRLIGFEYTLSDGCRVDVLCEEKRKNGKGALVAIELKNSQRGDELAGQIHRYLQRLAKDNPGRDVRGMIVCGPNDDTKGKELTAKLRWPVEWFQYDVQLKPV